MSAPRQAQPKCRSMLALALDDVAVEYFFTALHVIGGGDCVPAELAHALDDLRVAATSLSSSEEEVAAAKQSVLAAAAAVDAELPLKIEREAASRQAAASASAASKASMPTYLKKSCYVGHEMQEIAPRLFLGSYHPAGDKELLQRHGITHICCCINVQGRFRDEFKYMTLAAEDSPQYNVRQHFDATFAFIDEAVTNHGGVLVHCGAGISRAPTILAAYLMRKLRIPANTAVSMIRARRSVASPNLGFTAQLKEFEKELHL